MVFEVSPTPEPFMNATLHKTQTIAAIGRISIITQLRLAVMLAVLASVSLANAAVFVKTNNAANLNLATAWTNNAVPGAADIAQWDATVSDPNNTTNLLGANLSVGGVKIVDPAGPVQISAGNTLTLGTGGIDMSGALQDLTVAAGVTLPDYTVQNWSVPAGRTLSLSGAFTRSGGAALTVNANGIINIAGGTASSMIGYALYNGTDVAAWDASKNISSVGSVIGYIANPLTGLPSTQYVDVNSGNSGTTDDMYLNTSIWYPRVIRFNTPQPNRNYWSLNAYRGQFELNSGPNTILVTTNVGACDVIFKASGSGGITMGWRQTAANSELVLDQENTAGSIYFYNGFSQKTASLANILTKRGAGRAIFNTSLVHSGPTRILEGELMLNGSSVSTSVFTINSDATLSGTGNVLGPITNNGTIWAGTNGFGVLTTGGALTLNAGSALKFYSATVPATNTVAPLNVTNNLTVNGAVNVSILAGRLAVGQYPLIKWTNAISGTFNLAAIKPHVGAYLSNNVANMSLDLVVTNIYQPLTWAAGSATWQTNGGSIWNAPVIGSTTYQEIFGLGDSVLFEDSLSTGSPTVTLNTVLVPSSTTVSNLTHNYTISGSGAIAGSGSLTKAGSGALTLGTANTFTGGINLNGGTTTFSALNNLGAGAINFGGGTLQYNGNTDDISVRTVTLGAGGATINVGANDVSYASGIGNGGAGGLTKTGSGSLTLNGTNNYTGNTIVSNGRLALNGGAYIASSPAIVVNSGAFFDVSASGSIDLNGTVSQKLAGNGTVLGGVTLNSGASISPLTNGSIGTLTITNGSLTLNSGGTLMMDISSGSRDQINIGTPGYGLSLNGGTLALNVTGTLPYGSYTLITYPSGGLATGAASVSALSITGFAQAGAVATLDGSVDGQINLVISATATDAITWAGVGSDWDVVGTANWYLGVSTPWAFTNGDFVTFNDVGAAYPNVSLRASVSPASVTVTSDTTQYSFDDGGGKLSGAATLTKNGASTLTVNTVNDTTGNVVINGGTVQVNGHLGSGSISNKAELIFGQSTSRTVSGALSGAGNLTQAGSATLTLSANSPLFTGGVTISSGILQIGNGGATGSLGTTAGITNNSALTLNRTGSYTVASGIEGSGGLNCAAGTATLTGSNSYTGTTSIYGGSKLVMGSANAHAGQGQMTLGTGATNDMHGYDLTLSRLYSGTTTQGLIVNNSGSATTNTLTINGATAGDCDTVIADNDGTTPGVVRLVQSGTAELTLRGPSTYSGGTVINSSSVQARQQNAAFGTGPIILNGGTLNNYASTLSNPIQVLTNSGIYSAGNCYMSGPITGSSNLTVTCAGSTTSGQTITWNSSADLTGYTGTFYCVVDATTYGRFWRWGGSGGSASAAWDLQGNFNMSAQGAGYTILLGALSGTNGTWLSPNSTTYIIGGRNENTTFSGNVTGSGSINKTGSGTWTLDGTGYYIGTNTAFSSYTFSGSTVVSNGTLHLTGAANPTNSSSIQIKSGALLDLSGLGYQVFETNELDVVTNTYTTVTHRLDLSTNGNAQTLTGSGTLRGSVVAYANSTINPGDGIGTLTVTTNVTLGGTLIMELNTTNVPAINDKLVVGGTLVAGGTLTVNNLGPALQGGQTFQLFNTAVSGFTATNLPALTGQMYWVNNLAVDGSLSVVNPVNTNAPVMGVSYSGNTLTLSWPTNSGWTLQQQTNSLTTGLGTNWVDVPGSTSITSTNIMVDPTKPTVFYRLKL